MLPTGPMLLVLTCSNCDSTYICMHACTCRTNIITAAVLLVATAMLLSYSTNNIKFYRNYITSSSKYQVSNSNIICNNSNANLYIHTAVLMHIAAAVYLYSNSTYIAAVTSNILLVIL